jgi:DNA-binding response OmpR family regulator
MKQRKVLLIDDDPVIGKVLTLGLAQSGISCVHLASFAQASRFLETHLGNGGRLSSRAHKKNHGLADDIDAVLLDYHLDEGQTGLPLCRRISTKTHIPVVMLTGEKSAKITVKCLDEGADQYICKPFGIEELVARINASIRARKSSRVIRQVTPDVSICINNQELRFVGKRADLTEKESLLAEVLIRNTGFAVSKSELLDHVYGGSGSEQGRSLDMLVSRLRKKLAVTDGRCRILSARNVGYKLVVRKRYA